MIESPAPMVYRLSESDSFHSDLEHDVLGALNEKSMTARELAERFGKPVGSVRNLLTRMVDAGQVELGEKAGRGWSYRVKEEAA